MDKKILWIVGSIAAVGIIAFVIYRQFFEKPTVIPSKVGRADEGQTSPTTNTQIPTPNPQNPIPNPQSPKNYSIKDFTLANYKSGGSESLYGLLNQGKSIYIVVWASWCPYCKQEMPKIKELQDKIGANKNKVLLLISADKTLTTPTTTMKNAGLWDNANTIHLSDPEAKISGGALGLNGFPYHGFVSQSSIQKEITIDKLLSL